MNAVLLLVIAVPVFALGYLYYGKLVALGSFGIRSAAEPAPGAGSPVTLFGHHFAAVAGGTTISGVAVAAMWGWVPAFLWIVSGTVVGAGTLGMTALYLGREEPGQGFGDMIARLLTPHARFPFYFLAFGVLILLNAVLALIIGQLLDRHPAVALVLLVQIPAAVALSRWAPDAGRAGGYLLATAGVAIFILAAAAGDFLPLAVSGTLTLTIAGWRTVAVDGTAVWLVLALTYGLYAIRAPLWRLTAVRGALTTAGVAAALALLFIGVAIRHPAIAAPAFAADTSQRSLPWLFIVLTGGAVAGFQGLIAILVTARELPRAADARPLGFGVALLDGLLGIGVLLACSAGFTDTAGWHAAYKGSTDLPTLGHAIGVFINGFTYFVTALGLPRSFAATLGAATAAALALGTLENGLRAQQKLWGQLAGETGGKLPATARSLSWLAVGCAGLFAWWDGHGRGGLVLWPLFGGASQTLAMLLLLLASLYVLRQARLGFPLLAPLIFLALATSWGVGQQVTSWALDGRWFFALGGGGVLAAELWLLGTGLGALRRLPRLQGPPPAPWDLQQNKAP